MDGIGARCGQTWSASARSAWRGALRAIWLTRFTGRGKVFAEGVGARRYVCAPLVLPLYFFSGRGRSGAVLGAGAIVLAGRAGGSIRNECAAL